MSILKGNGKKIIETTIKVIGICSILPVLGIFAYIIFKGVPAITWSFITEGPKSGMREGGIFPVIVGSILLTIGTIIAAVPFGILTGIYLVEYSNDNWLRRIINLTIVNLCLLYTSPSPRD